MVCERFCVGDSVIHRLDPRARIVVAAIFAVIIALADGTRAPAVGAALGLSLAALARLPVAALFRRFAALNIFMFVLILMIGLTMPGAAFIELGPVALSHEGLIRGLQIALKANAIFFSLVALMGTIDMSTLGHAFNHLRVPDKLTLLFLFTVRYVDVLYHEYLRLARAMKARCFRPRANLHTYRSRGYLVGVLLLRSLERAERVTAAMKCRGFTGKFHVIDHFQFKRADTVFCAMATALLTVLIWIQYI